MARLEITSTTGAGTEGALTKGPFNALCATADLNNALVSMMLTGYAGFSSAAGWIGPHYRFDHDISLLVPELWCRLFPQERDPNRLIAEGCLEQVADFERDGRKVCRIPRPLVCVKGAGDRTTCRPRKPRVCFEHDGREVCRARRE